MGATRRRPWSAYQSTAIADVAGTQVGEDVTFGMILLADVLPQQVHGVGLAPHEAFEGARRPHRAELAMVADEDRLGPGRLRLRQQAQQGRVVGHRRLVDDQHRAGVEAEPVMFSRHNSDATVRDSMFAWSPRVRAACPDVDVPTTR